MTVPLLEVHLTEDEVARSLRADARAGLTDKLKWLPPKWFYDARGSELFDQITRLPEYYPTRAESAALAAHAADIAEHTKANTLVELGSGSAEKTPLLLDALAEAGTLQSMVMLDVSSTALEEAAHQAVAQYPGITVHGVVGDFTVHLPLLPKLDNRLVAFLGGTIGNLVPAERAVFLANLRSVLRPGEHLLLGTDLVKDPATLVAAYDDAAGVTAEFNKNVLRVLNRELDAEFDVDAFEHRSVWNPEQEWVEMRLRATKAMRVPIPLLAMDVEFAEGEEMRTEVSAKFRKSRVADELTAAGFELRDWWTDPQDQFAISLARAV